MVQCRPRPAIQCSGLRHIEHLDRYGEPGHWFERACGRKELAPNRSALLPTGLKALWLRVTGKYRAIKKQNENEAKRCKLRDQTEQQF